MQPTMRKRIITLFAERDPDLPPLTAPMIAHMAYGPNVGASTVSSALRSLVADGLLKRVGWGHRGNPYRYYKPAKRD